MCGERANFARMAGRSEPFVLGPGEGRFIDPGRLRHVKANETETGDVVSVLEADEPPGFGPPIHVHHDCAEALYDLVGDTPCLSTKGVGPSG
jgi:hypothetical protein